MNETLKSILNLIKSNIYLSILSIIMILNIFIPLILILQLHFHAFILYPIRSLLIFLFGLESINETLLIDYSSYIFFLIFSVSYIKTKKTSILKFINIFFIYHFFLALFYFTFDIRHWFDFFKNTYFELVTYNLIITLLFIIFIKILKHLNIFLKNKSSNFQIPK